MRLLLREPRLNTQAKPVRDGVAEANNYARNSPEQLAAPNPKPPAEVRGRPERAAACGIVRRWEQP